MPITHYYRLLDSTSHHVATVKKTIQSKLESAKLAEDAALVASASLKMEHCFNVEVLTVTDMDLFMDDHVKTTRLEWLLSETYDKSGFQRGSSNFKNNIDDDDCLVLEFGPRMTFTSAFSSNATQICQACGIDCISRLERSRRYCLSFPSLDNDKCKGKGKLTTSGLATIKNALHDRMTEEEYVEAKLTFSVNHEPEKVQIVPIMKEGRAALERINEKKGLGFDDFDLDYYTDLFRVSMP